MRALVYHGPRKVSVDAVPDPTIEKPADALIRIPASRQPEFNTALVSFLGR